MKCFRMALSAMVLSVVWPGEALAAGCTVTSSGLAFGEYLPLTATSPILSDASLSVSCTGLVLGGLTYVLTLGPSAAGSGNRITPDRFMSNSNGGALMRFNVYTDFGRSNVWGDGITGNGIPGSFLTDGSHSITVYGKVPASQSTLKAGSFSAPLTMTITHVP
jgi:spore coat protein U-like protein